MGRALVTGADGLVGAWVVRALLARGEDVVVLRRSGEQPREDVVAVEADLRDPTAVDRALAKHPCDAVFHLGAQSVTGRARRAPIETFEVNVAGTWHLLEACRARGVSRVVVASSDKVYGPGAALPTPEDQPLAPRFPYEVSKACADLVARSFFHAYGLPVAVARTVNVYGGGDRQRSRLVPALCGAILAGRAPVIHSDGSPRRDFLHASDAAAAYLLLADELAAGRGGGEAFNVGSGASHAVREVVDLLLELSGSPVEAEYQDVAVPEGQVADELLDAARLRERTGWAPRIGLRDGLERTLAWYREHPEVLG